MANERFEIDGFQFELSMLPVGESLKLLPTVLRILPQMKAAQSTDNPARMMAGLVRTFEEMIPVVDLFKNHCKACKPGESNAFLPMVSTFDNLFARKQMTILQWAVKCVELEYGDFLQQAFPSPAPEESESDSSSPPTS